MKCLSCGLLNREDARFCNECRAPFPVMIRPAPIDYPKNSNGRWIVAILLCLAVGGCLFSAVFNSLFPNWNQTTQSIAAPEAPSDPDVHWNSTSGKIEAFVMSQEFVTKRLKAPGSASFPYYTDSDVAVSHDGAGIFMVKAYVDSQNSFGAKLRTHYLCSLKDNGDKTWALLSLTMK